MKKLLSLAVICWVSFSTVVAPAGEGRVETPEEGRRQEQERQRELEKNRIDDEGRLRDKEAEARQLEEELNARRLKEEQQRQEYEQRAREELQQRTGESEVDYNRRVQDRATELLAEDPQFQARQSELSQLQGSLESSRQEVTNLRGDLKQNATDMVTSIEQEQPYDAAATGYTDVLVQESRNIFSSFRERLSAVRDQINTLTSWFSGRLLAMKEGVSRTVEVVGKTFGDYLFATGRMLGFERDITLESKRADRILQEQQRDALKQQIDGLRDPDALRSTIIFDPDNRYKSRTFNDVLSRKQANAEIDAKEARGEDLTEKERTTRDENERWITEVRDILARERTDAESWVEGKDKTNALERIQQFENKLGELDRIADELRTAEQGIATTNAEIDSLEATSGWMRNQLRQALRIRRINKVVQFTQDLSSQGVAALKSMRVVRVEDPDALQEGTSYMEFPEQKRYAEDVAAVVDTIDPEQVDASQRSGIRQRLQEMKDALDRAQKQLLRTRDSVSSAGRFVMDYNSRGAEELFQSELAGHRENMGQERLDAVGGEVIIGGERITNLDVLITKAFEYFGLDPQAPETVETQALVEEAYQRKMDELGNDSNSPNGRIARQMGFYILDPMGREVYRPFVERMNLMRQSEGSQSQAASHWDSFCRDFSSRYNFLGNVDALVNYSEAISQQMNRLGSLGDAIAGKIAAL